MRNEAKIAKLHKEAMHLAFRADAARCEGLCVSANILFRKAWRKERKAWLMVSDDRVTKGILLKSAAYLAKDAGMQEQADELFKLYEQQYNCNDFGPQKGVQ